MIREIAMPFSRLGIRFRSYEPRYILAVYTIKGELLYEYKYSVLLKAWDFFEYLQSVAHVRRYARQYVLYSRNGRMLKRAVVSRTAFCHAGRRGRPVKEAIS